MLMRISNTDNFAGLQLIVWQHEKNKMKNEMKSERLGTNVPEHGSVTMTRKYRTHSEKTWSHLWSLAMLGNNFVKNFFSFWLYVTQTTVWVLWNWKRITQTNAFLNPCTQHQYLKSLGPKKSLPDVSYRFLACNAFIKLQWRFESFTSFLLVFRRLRLCA